MDSKKCKECKKIKSVPSGFFRSGRKTLSGKEILTAKCKSCIYKQRNQRRKETTAWINEYKQTQQCKKCGYSEKTHENFVPQALEFHHPQGNKDFAIGDAASRGMGKERIMNEISKCVILCSRCHTEIHNRK